jgi:hypothetical protein
MEMIHIINIIAGLILCVSFLEAMPKLHKFAKWLGGFDTIIGLILIIYVIVWGTLDLYGIVAIFAGLIMIVGILPAIPAVGKNLEKVAKWLGGFQGIIGIIILIVGILGALAII